MLGLEGDKKMNRKEKLLQEFKLRRLVRKAIRIKQQKDKNTQNEKLIEEEKLRKIISYVLKEGDVDSDTKPAPYASTPVNALADAFNQILPVLKSGLRKWLETLPYVEKVVDADQQDGGAGCSVVWLR